MKLYKKALALFLTLTFLLSCVSVSVSAADKTLPDYTMTQAETVPMMNRLTTPWLNFDYMSTELIYSTVEFDDTTFRLKIYTYENDNKLFDEYTIVK